MTSKESPINTKEPVRMILTSFRNQEHEDLDFTMLIFSRKACDKLAHFKPCPRIFCYLVIRDYIS